MQSTTNEYNVKCVLSVWIYLFPLKMCVLNWHLVKKYFFTPWNVRQKLDFRIKKSLPNMLVFIRFSSNFCSFQMCRNFRHVWKILSKSVSQKWREKNINNMPPAAAKQQEIKLDIISWKYFFYFSRNCLNLRVSSIERTCNTISNSNKGKRNKIDLPTLLTQALLCMHNH